MRWRWGRLCVAGFLAVVAACSSSGGDDAEPLGRPVSEGDALAVLDRAVALASGGDLEGLCDLTRARPMCEHSLDDMGRASVPEASPVVVRTTAVEPVVRPDGGGTFGGRVVEVCGLDGHGTPYRSEVMVLDRGDGAMNPVYWAGIDYVSADADGWSVGGSTSTLPPAGGPCP